MKIFFMEDPFHPPTSVFDAVLIPDRELSADDAQVISGFDFNADTSFSCLSDSPRCQ
jgi:hypothetical protein